MLHVVEVLKKKKKKILTGDQSIFIMGGGKGDGRGFEGGGVKEFSGGTEGGSNVTNRV